MIQRNDLILEPGYNPKLVDCICSYLGVDNDSASIPNHASNEEKARFIADALIGSKKIRLGNCPCDEEKAYAQKRILEWIKVGKPIEIVSLWGALKGYGQFKGRSDADIMDLMGVRRFEGLHRRISSVYSPGIKVKILREDVGEIALTGDLNLPEQIGPYSRSLDSVCDALGVSDHVVFVDESKLLKERQVTSQEFLRKGQENAQAFFQYWLASNSKDPSSWESLPEYKKLTEIGWKGVIPQCMRQHYLDRTRTELPLAPEDRLITRVCTYFGIAFARYQVSLYKGEALDENGKIIPPFKASFVPYPPGADSGLRLGRFEYKVKDDKHSNNTTPPWAGIGFMVRKGPELFEPSISGVRACRGLCEKDYQPVMVTLNKNGHTALFRADVLSKTG